MLDCQRVEIRTLKHSHVASDITNFTSAVCAVVTEMSSFGEPIFETWANTYSGDLYETFTTVNTYSSFWLQTDDIDVNNFVYSNSANILQSNNTVNNTSANWNSVYNSFNVTSAGFLTEVTADVRYVNISGDTMTGGLSSPSLSTNSLYVAGSTINFFDQTGSVIETLKSNDVRDFKSNYTLTNSHSANWDSVYSSFSSQSANNSSVYNTVQSNSSTTWNYQGSDIKSLTSNWENTYSDFRVQSGNNISVYNSFNSNSSNYDSVYNTVNSNSATTWNYQGSDIKSLTSNWQDTYSNFSFQSGDNTSVYNTVQDYSALWIIDNTIDLGVRSLTSNWEDTYNTVQSNSGNWNYQGTDIKSLTSNWENTYTNFSIQSGDNTSVYNSFNSNSSNYNSVYNTVQSNSATTWNYQGTDLKALTSDWEDTYNTVQSNSSLWAIDSTVDLGVRALTSNWEDTYNTVQDYSALWIIDNSIDLGVRALTGNWEDTYINFSTQSANNIGVYNTVNSNSASWIGGATGDYLPLSGGTITGHLTVTEYLSTPLINLVTTGVTATTVKGDVFWDVNDDTLAIDMGNGVVQQVGFEQYIEIKANGSNIDNGTVVWATDAVSSGNSGIIRGTNNVADGNTPARFLLGVATEDILSGENGRVTTFGVVREVNLGSYADSGETWAVGQVLYPSPTISGGWTNVEPVAPRLAMPIAFILFINNGTTKSNVTMMVRVDSGYDLHEIHDVLISSPTNNDLLTYSSSASAWVNSGNINTLLNSNSSNWSSVYNTVQSNSAINWNYQGTDLKALTSNWQSTYISFQSQSANNALVFTNVNSNSANWNSSYTTVNLNSAIWADPGTGDVNVNSFVYSQSANILDTITTVQDYSALWILSGGSIDNETDPLFTSWAQTFSADYESVYTTVQTNSASWGTGGGGGVPLASYTRWQLVGANATTVYSISGAETPTEESYRVTINAIIQDPATYTIDEVADTITFSSNPPLSSDIIVIENKIIGSDVTSLTANWQNTSSVVQSNSASWAGAGGSTNMWIPASLWIPRTLSGCGVDSRELSGNRQNFDELLFDAGLNEFAQALAIFPNNYNNGTITSRFYWTASTGSGDVVWGIQGRAFANDDSLDSAFGVAQTVTDSLLAINDMHVSNATSVVTLAGTPAANTPIQLQIYRDAAAGSDTMANDARLLGVEIIYTSA